MLKQSIIETSSEDPIEIADSVELQDSGKLICKNLGNKIYRHIEYRIEISICRIDIVSNQKS